MRDDTQAFSRTAGSGDARAQRVPPAREAWALFYAVVACTLVQFPPIPASIQGDDRVFCWFGLNFLALFVGPVLIIRYVWRRPLSAYGLQWGRRGVWMPYFLIFLGIMVPVVLLISRTADFHTYYPRLMMSRVSFGGFLLGALGWLVYFLAWEFFFRGFLLFTLAPRYGGAIAILIQTIPFVMMHYTKLPAEAWSAILCGIALGIMSFRGRSCIGPWLLHWSVATLMDLIVVVWPLR